MRDTKLTTLAAKYATSRAESRKSAGETRVILGVIGITSGESRNLDLLPYTAPISSACPCPMQENRALPTLTGCAGWPVC
jgi:hypothetical protein